MRHMFFLVLMTFIASLTSCANDDDENFDFYDAEYRKGLWISPDKKDTLQFIDDSNMIRKGDFYIYEELIYRITEEKIFLRLGNSTGETQHRILKVDKNSIVLENMYITTGFTDNSGTFFKEE